MSQPPAPSGPALERLLLDALIGAGVAIACLVPPVVHFISGPLGPLIGGAVAGGRSRARGLSALVIGAIVFVYSSLLGWLGALIGAWFARGQGSRAPEPTRADEPGS